MSDRNLVFAQAISAHEDQIDVAYAALLYAWEACPDLKVDRYLGRLDDMAQAVRPRLAHHRPIVALEDFLFEKLGFCGNVEEIRDLGVLHYCAGRKLKAIGCLERYLDLTPDAEDTKNSPT